MMKVFLVMIFALSATLTIAADDAETIFRTRCAACHKFGSKFIGPDLAGVTERRERDWLVKFIHSSQNLIQSGDATARQLFIEYNQTSMPDNKDLTDAQMEDLLAYIFEKGKAISVQIAEGGKDAKNIDYLGQIAERNKAEGAMMKSTEFKIIYWGALVIIIAFVMWLGHVISIVATSKK